MNIVAVAELFSQMKIYIDCYSLVSDVSYGCLLGNMEKHSSVQQTRMINFMARGWVLYDDLCQYIDEMPSVSDDELAKRVKRIVEIAEHCKEISMRSDGADAQFIRDVLDKYYKCVNPEEACATSAQATDEAHVSNDEASSPDDALHVSKKARILTKSSLPSC